jgi:hypothetical protein
MKHRSFDHLVGTLACERCGTEYEVKANRYDGGRWNVAPMLPDDCPGCEEAKSPQYLDRFSSADLIAELASRCQPEIDPVTGEVLS